MLTRNHPLRICGGLIVRMLRLGCNYLRLVRLRYRGLHYAGMSYIDPRARFSNPSNITIGRNCVINDCFFYALDKIDVGNRTIIGRSVFLCTGSHDLYSEDFHLTTKPITIGGCVWIATGATILPGVNVGDGAVIGAMAVVSRDVPTGAVVAGNPARVVRTGRAAPTRFDPLSLASLDVGPSIRRLRDVFRPKREM